MEPSSPPPASSSLRQRPRTETEEVVHALRNCVSAVQYGVAALSGMRTSEAEFASFQKAITEKLRTMNEVLVRVVDLLEEKARGPKVKDPARVLCVDADPRISAMMRFIIDAEPTLKCVGCLGSTDDLVSEVRHFHEARVTSGGLVVLLDATAPGKSFVAVLAELAETPDVRAVIYNGPEDAAHAKQAQCARVWRSLPASAGPEAIMIALRDAAAALGSVGGDVPTEKNEP